MKIAISSSGKDENSLVANRFARAEFFIIYNHEDLSFEVVENNAKNEGSGAGGKAVKLLGDLKIDVVLAPELGPKALEALNAFGIISHQYPKEKTVRDVLYMYFEKKLPSISEAKGKKTHS